MIGQARLDVFDLERLFEISHNLDGFVARHFNSLKSFVVCDNFFHLSLNGREILFGDRTAGPHVVVKARANGRPKRQFNVIEQTHHRAGHHVCCRMPHNSKSL